MATLAEPWPESGPLDLAEGAPDWQRPGPDGRSPASPPDESDNSAASPEIAKASSTNATIKSADSVHGLRRRETKWPMANCRMAAMKSG